MHLRPGWRRPAPSGVHTTATTLDIPSDGGANGGLLEEQCAVADTDRHDVDSVSWIALSFHRACASHVPVPTLPSPTLVTVPRSGRRRVTDASSSQGILYAMESHYVTVGKKVGGFVLQVAARVVSKHSLNVMAGHDDIYALLASGYTIIVGANPQEAADLAAEVPR